MTEIALDKSGASPSRDYAARQAEHNKRLAALAASHRLTAEHVFGGDRLTDVVKGYLADWIKENHGHDCRDADGKIDFVSGADASWGDCWGVIDALLPIVIEIYDRQYGGNVTSGVRHLEQKASLINEHLAAGNYIRAVGCMSDGTT